MPVNTWITGVTDNSGVGKLVGWQTSDDSNKGLYEVTITARDATCYITSVSATYTLDVRSMCQVPPITIDPNDTIFKIPSLIYDVYQQPSGEILWSDTDAQIANPTVDCGPIEFEITNLDGTTIDPLLFAHTQNITPGQHGFFVQTDDELKEGLYDFTIKAWYTGYATNVGSKDF